MADLRPIVVVGSINMDLVASTARIPLAGETVSGTDFHTYAGGKGANQAVAVGRLGYPVKMIGRLGEDGFGEELERSLIEAGADTAGVEKVAGSSGVAVIVVSAEGQNCIVVVPGSNGLLLPADLDAHVEVIRSAGMVLSQLEIPLETVVRLAEICEREGVPLMLDPAPARELPAELISKVTWFTPNETEANFYLGDAAGSAASASDVAKALLRMGVRNVLLKRGEQGFLIASEDGRMEAQPAFAVKAMDTTAAGDAFNGAFAVALAQGRSALESGRFASAAAAISVTRAGAQPSMPNLGEVEEFLLIARPV